MYHRSPPSAGTHGPGAKRRYIELDMAITARIHLDGDEELARRRIAGNHGRPRKELCQPLREPCDGC